MGKSSKKLYGVGINDANYFVVVRLEDGSKHTCKYYSTWCDMLARCYREKYQKLFPSYKDCYVCNEWLMFSNFKSWMEQQDWFGNVLDKDLLLEGNKCYSPETCIFVPPKVNGFLVIKHGRNSSGLIGASYQTTSRCKNKWISSCSQLNNKNKTLGRFPTVEGAHFAWCLFKAKLAYEIAEEQVNMDVKNGLIAFGNKLMVCWETKTPFLATKDLI